MDQADKNLVYMEDDPIKGFHLDHEMLAKLVKWNCQNNPKFIGTTTEDRARICGISESTYKSILSGKNTKPRIDILYAIAKAFNGRIDPLVGLAPPRDYEREKEHYDATFMESMNHQLEAANAKITAQTEAMAELKGELREANAERKALQRELDTANEHCKEHAEECKALQRELRRHRIYIAVTSIAALVVLIGALYL